MKIIILLFMGLLLIGFSPVYSRVLKTNIHVISFSDPQSSSCAFPEFYFSCRTYLVHGESQFKPFFVNQKGEVKEASDLKLQRPIWRTAMWHAAETVSGKMNYSKEPSVANSEIYPGKNWKVRIIWDPTESDAPMCLEYRSQLDQPTKRLEVPQGVLSFGLRPLFFDKDRNLFFFAYTDGPTGGRDDWLWVFNLNNGVLSKIGETICGFPLFVNSNKRWLEWTDSKQELDIIGGKHVLSGHVVLYDVETGMKYRFNEGISIGYFYDWKKK